MIKTEEKLQKQIRLYLILILTGIFCINVYGINYITLWSDTDTFGFWSSAAYFSGIDWSMITSGFGYFSYGYGLLMSPFVLLFDSSTQMYQFSLVLNAVMVCGIFLLAYQILTEFIFKEEAASTSPPGGGYNSLWIACATTLYPTYIVYSSIGAPEILISFLGWVILYLILKIEKEASFVKVFFLGILTVYVFMLHQRALGITLSVIAVVVLLKIFNKLDYKYLLLYFFIVLVLFFVHSRLKEFVQTNVWNNSNMIKVNDFGGQKEKIKFILSESGIRNLFTLFCCSIYYLSTGTALLWLLGLKSILMESFQGLIHLKDQMLRKIENKKEFNFSIGTIFVLFASMASIAISSIFMVKGELRQDQLVYGRYIEMMVGPVLMYGLVEAFSLFEKKGRELYSIVIKIVFCYLFVFYVTKNGESYLVTKEQFLYIKSIVFGFYYRRGEVLLTWAMMISTIVFFITIPFFNSKKFVFKRIAIFICCLFMAIPGIWMKKHQFPFKDSIDVIRLKMVGNYLEKNEIKDEDLFFVMDKEKPPIYYGALLNFYFKDMINIDVSEIDQIPNESYVLMSEDNKKDLTDVGDLKLVYLGARYSVYQKNGMQNEIELSLQKFSTKIPAESPYYFESHGENDYLFYGPYMNLKKGNYTLLIDYDVIEVSNTDNLGKFDIVSKGKEIFVLNLQETETSQIAINFEVPEDMSGVEYRWFNTAGNSIRINDISIIKEK